jgi:hypothetical protein
MAACREGDTLVVTKLDRLARSLPDAQAIADELTCSVSLAPPSTAPSNATRQPADRETADAVPQKHQCRAPAVERLNTAARAANRSKNGQANRVCAPVIRRRCRYRTPIRCRVQEAKLSSAS